MELVRLDDYRWLIPKHGKMRVDGLVFAGGQHDLFDLDVVVDRRGLVRAHPQVLRLDGRDRVKLPETARESRREPPRPLLEHGDRVDVAEAPARRLVHEALVPLETRTFTLEDVRVVLPAPHGEEDRAIVHDVGFPDAVRRDAILRRAVEAFTLGVLVLVRVRRDDRQAPPQSQSQQTCAQSDLMTHGRYPPKGRVRN